jgi:hypothetical protein
MVNPRVVAGVSGGRRGRVRAHADLRASDSQRDGGSQSGGGEWFGAEGAVFGSVVACFGGSLWAKLPNRERRGCNEKWPRKQWEEEGLGLIKRGRVR